MYEKNVKVSQTEMEEASMFDSELNPKYKNILELKSKLDEEGIPNELCRIFDGWGLCYPNIKNKQCDVVCHRYSYGGSDDLMEAIGFDECGDDVIGYLNVADALTLFKLFYLRIKGDDDE